jgi:pectinesterase
VVLACALAGVAPPARTATSQPRAIRIVLVGDSTVTDGSGWGFGFKQWLGPGAECLNTASNGRSSKSYIDEGAWNDALAQHGDYYLIQFGHNDMPGKGPDRETDADDVREHVAIDDARAIGAREFT